jgi:hypothetical protein
MVIGPDISDRRAHIQNGIMEDKRKFRRIKIEDVRRGIT